MEEIKRTVPFFYSEGKVAFVASICECGGIVNQIISYYQCDKCHQIYMPSLVKKSSSVPTNEEGEQIESVIVH